MGDRRKEVAGFFWYGIYVYLPSWIIGVDIIACW